MAFDHPRSTDPVPASVDRRVGAYRLLSLLGSGGMGQVYLAERADGQYEQRVAVKVLREDALDAPHIARFKSEWQTLARLDHPNIAKILDAGIGDDGAPYFVMEHVVGQPIDEHCKTLATSDTLRLFRSVCQAVHYAHRQGVVHRDLKPANILVTTGGIVKLVDFGIAKRLDVPASSTATARPPMTLDYASPEQVRGDSVTAASDVFSLGVVLYRLLTHASPYPDGATGSDYALRQAICDTDALAPSRRAEPPLRRRLRGDLDAVLLMALRKDPALRYATAEALGDDVFRHLEGLPVQARRGAWVHRAGRFLMRHRAMVGAAVLANLALVASLGLAAFQAFEAQRQKERAERHFASVRRLAEVFIVDIDQAIARLPGALQARKTIVDTGLTYLQQLSQEAGTDPALQLELATGYRHIGDIQGAGSMGSLGDSAGAMRSYDRALALVQPLTQAAPNRRAAQHEYVMITTRKGMLLAAQGRWSEAETIHDAGVAAGLALVHAEPGNYAYQRALANQWLHLANLHQLAGHAERFLATSEQALQQLQKVNALEPDDLDIVSNLSAVHGLRAMQLMDNDTSAPTLRRALAEYRRSLAALHAAHQKNPGHLIIATNYAKVQGLVGNLLTDLGQHQDALAHVRRAVALTDDLVARDPDNVRLRSDQAQVYDDLGYALMAVRDVPAAVAAYARSIELFKRLPDSTRDEVLRQYNMGVGHYHHGHALEAQAALRTRPAERQADVAAACANYRRSELLLRLNEKRQPSNALSIAARKQTQDALRRCPPP